MIDLNEYLGGIANSIAEARLISDLKSVEIAEKFAKHDLLKHFSIPRFKAQNIELTIPVAIGALENNYAKDYEPIDNIGFSSQAYGVLKDIAKQKSFARGFSASLKSVINKRIEVLERDIKAGNEEKTTLNDFSSSLSNEFLDLYFDHIKDEFIVDRLFSDLMKFAKPIDKESFTTLTIEGLIKVFNQGKLDIEVAEKLRGIIYEGIKILEEERKKKTGRSTEIVYYHKAIMLNYAENIIRKTISLFKPAPLSIDVAKEKLVSFLQSRSDFIGGRGFYGQTIKSLNVFLEKITNRFSLVKTDDAVQVGAAVAIVSKERVLPTPVIAVGYNIEKEVLSLVDSLEGNVFSKTALLNYVDKVAKGFLFYNRKRVEPKPIIEKLNTSLISAIKEREIENQKPKVIVESHKLQDIKPENVIQIKMTLNEEGLEWHTSENEKGEVSTQLLPE